MFHLNIKLLVMWHNLDRHCSWWLLVIMALLEGSHSHNSLHCANYLSHHWLVGARQVLTIIVAVMAPWQHSRVLAYITNTMGREDVTEIQQCRQHRGCSLSVLEEDTGEGWVTGSLVYSSSSLVLVTWGRPGRICHVSLHPLWWQHWWAPRAATWPSPVLADSSSNRNSMAVCRVRLAGQWGPPGAEAIFASQPRPGQTASPYWVTAHLRSARCWQFITYIHTPYQPEIISVY